MSQYFNVFPEIALSLFNGVFQSEIDSGESWHQYFSHFRVVASTMGRLSPSETAVQTLLISSPPGLRPARQRGRQVQVPFRRPVRLWQTYDSLSLRRCRSRSPLPLPVTRSLLCSHSRPCRCHPQISRSSQGSPTVLYPRQRPMPFLRAQDFVPYRRRRRAS